MAAKGRPHQGDGTLPVCPVCLPAAKDYQIDDQPLGGGLAAGGEKNVSLNRPDEQAMSQCGSVS